MNFIMKKFFISIIISIFTINLNASLNQSARKLATGGVSSTFYDTYDYITIRPDMLTKVKGFQIIIFPSEFPEDISSIIDIISHNKEKYFDNTIGIVYGLNSIGIGAHFKYNYQNIYQNNPSYSLNKTFSDNDSDNNFNETNEVIQTSISGATNFEGVNNIDFGISGGFNKGMFHIGGGLNIYNDTTISDNSISVSSIYSNKYNSSSYLSPYYTSENNSYAEDTLKNYEVIFNFKLNKEKRVKMGYSIGKTYTSFLLLQTKFNIVDESTKNYQYYTNIINYDPNQTNKNAYNKTIICGTIITPETILNSSLKGYYLTLFPSIYIYPAKKLTYIIKGKFKSGLNLQNTYSEISRYSSSFYSSAGTIQDIYKTKTISESEYSGSTSYFLYGFKIIQKFTPKFLTIAVALDTSIENQTISLTGTRVDTQIKEYLTTSTSYTLQSGTQAGEKERTVTTTSPTINLTQVTKSITTTIKIPVAMEFKLSKKLTLRYGYSYNIVNIYTKTTTTTNTTSDITTTKIDYASPSETDTTTQGYTGEKYDNSSTTINNTRSTYAQIKFGLSYKITEKVQVNVGGSYDVENQTTSFILDTKLKF